MTQLFWHLQVWKWIPNKIFVWRGLMKVQTAGQVLSLFFSKVIAMYLFNDLILCKGLYFWWLWSACNISNLRIVPGFECNKVLKMAVTILWCMTLWEWVLHYEQKLCKLMKCIRKRLWQSSGYYFLLNSLFIFPHSYNCSKGMKNKITNHHLVGCIVF